MDMYYPIPKSRENSFYFRVSVCSRSGQVVVQHIEVDEIFISTRKEVSLDLDFRLSLFYSSVSFVPCFIKRDISICCHPFLSKFQAEAVDIG